jgi:integron cassette protein
MPRTVDEIDDLQEYVTGVMERADHHAGDVGEIALAIAGALIWRKEGEIKVYERQGKMTNALWVTISGKKYALAYNHDAKTIELREGSIQGSVVKSFTNRTPISEVKDFFASL